MKTALYSVTITLAHRFGMTPFQLLREDAGEVVELFNAIVETAPRTDHGEPPEAREEAKPRRRKVTPETSTGGWF